MNIIFNTRIYIRIILPLISILLINGISFSQSYDSISAVNKTAESFFKLADGPVKKEIAFFTVAGASVSKNSKHTKSELRNIRCVYSTDTSIVFDNAGLFNADIIVSIKSIIINSRRKIKEVAFVRDTKRRQILPDSAIEGLYDPNFSCNSKNKNANCKVLLSKDKKRVYVYMLNGNGNTRYEITWIIQDDKYYGRVIDPVRESSEKNIY